MKKRKKDSSVIQQNGAAGAIKRLSYDVKAWFFPLQLTFYVKGENAALSPAMSRRQIASVARRICHAALQSAKRPD